MEGPDAQHGPRISGIQIACAQPHSIDHCVSSFVTVENMNTPMHELSTLTHARTVHVLPFVYEDTDTKALHFTIHQQQSLMRISRPHALQVDYTQVMMGYLLLHRHPQHIKHGEILPPSRTSTGASLRIEL